ncbi:MAG: hypothetical protein WC294_02215 [Methanoregula sp.]|jgi:hypothetical protein
MGLITVNKNFLPHNVDGIVALLQVVDGDASKLSADQLAVCRDILHLDDPRSIAERTIQTVSNFEVQKFLDELSFRQKTSPWILIKAVRIIRFGTESQRQRMLAALEPLMGNDWVRKMVLEEGAL